MLYMYKIIMILKQDFVNPAYMIVGEVKIDDRSTAKQRGQPA